MDFFYHPLKNLTCHVLVSQLATISQCFIWKKGSFGCTSSTALLLFYSINHSTCFVLDPVCLPSLHLIPSLPQLSPFCFHLFPFLFLAVFIPSYTSSFLHPASSFCPLHLNHLFLFPHSYIPCSIVSHSHSFSFPTSASDSFYPFIALILPLICSPPTSFFCQNLTPILLNKLSLPPSLSLFLSFPCSLSMTT